MTNPTELHNYFTKLQLQNYKKHMFKHTLNYKKTCKS